jgi:histidinol phosphatase-like PHP family hydrolase
MSRIHPSNHKEIQAGSRWWKVDFHTHTGHSTDAYKSGDYTDRGWLLAHMRKEIDAVCITDHNGGRQIDLLKAEYGKMHGEFLLDEEGAEEDFREVVLFPGAELTTSEVAPDLRPVDH